MINKIKEWSGVIALVAVVLFLILNGSGKSPARLGGVINNCGGTVTCYTDLGVTNGLYVAAQSWLGGNTDATAVSTQTSVGTISGTNSGVSYSASSTLFSAVNPYSATSTASITLYDVVGQATTSSLQVGTSTALQGLSSTSVSKSLVNAITIATTTHYDIVSGLTTNADASAGSNSTFRIVVAPNVAVSAFATTTAGGNQAANYIPGLSGTYKIVWSR